jgi:hypothetical protein
MYRSGRLHSKLQRDSEDKIVRFHDGKAKQSLDHHSMLEYEYEFATHITLDTNWDKDYKGVHEQDMDKEQLDMLFDMMVKDFAYELANRMKYKNYKNLELHGITPNMVIWDK